MRFKTKPLAKAGLLLILTIWQSIALADLLISPTRVVFNERERTQTVTLINNGKKTQSYRFEWINQRAIPEGGYATLTDTELLTFPNADTFLRVSPRQVTLHPGERQTVKVLARRPRDLPQGEYRSHLQFTALPPKSLSEDDGGMQIQLNLLLSYNIPVIVRQGELEVNTSIQHLSLLPELDAKNNATIAVRLSHSGTSSVIGRLRAFWRDEISGKETQVGVLNNVTIYPETSLRDARIQWPNFSVNGSGELRVTFEGVNEFNGERLGELTVPIAIAEN